MWAGPLGDRGGSARAGKTRPGRPGPERTWPVSFSPNGQVKTPPASGAEVSGNRPVWHHPEPATHQAPRLTSTQGGEDRLLLSQMGKLRLTGVTSLFLKSRYLRKSEPVPGPRPLSPDFPCGRRGLRSVRGPRAQFSAGRGRHFRQSQAPSAPRFGSRGWTPSS